MVLMKYLLFVVGVLVFGFASAQKDGLYYFQEQLKKKKEKQRFIMRYTSLDINILTGCSNILVRVFPS